VGESELIGRTSALVTQKSIERDLRALGVAEGDVLIVHSSLSSLGWVAGGAAAVVDALLAVIGDGGTLSMPAHSGDWSDPSGWENPPVPETWWDEIRAERPGFDPYATPLREMGRVAENLLMRRATVRSGHPLHSHMANGPHAALIVEHHPVDSSFGDRSPLGRLFDLDATVVLLGVGHDRNTSLHLAEARAHWCGKGPVEFRSKVSVDGDDRQLSWMADDIDADDFGQLGDVLDESGLVKRGMVGQAITRVASMRQLVETAVPWFEAHRA
jgi:aminoglycoside 3-N-acetyltransferase